MQSPPKKMAAVSMVTENAEAAAMDSDCISESDIEASIVGVKPSSFLHNEYLPHGDVPSLDIRYLVIFICTYLMKYHYKLNPYVRHLVIFMHI